MTEAQLPATMTVGSLFSGIGGLDLGLERAGMTVKWQSEIDPYACKVLAKHWPKVVNHGDIKLIDWSRVEPVDVICGGYPCQPFSTAGKRNGTDDPRHLWPWVKQAISELRPRYALMENVRGHLSLGFAEVLADLTAIGYDAEWRVISAASVGANHRRDRVIIVAYPGQQFWNGRRHLKSAGTANEQNAIQEPLGGSSSDVANATQLLGNGIYNNTRDSEQSETLSQLGNSSGAQNVANTNIWEVGGRDRRLQHDSRLVFGSENIRRGTQEYAGWQWWETEPDVGRVADGISSRVDRLKCLGNAVVPQVAEIVGRLIIDAEN
jgi:DNA (cytosine-5)-methyltransferase 1